MCSPSNKRSSATRQQPNNPRHLYASVDPCKERGTIESCQDDLATANSNCSGGRREVNLLIVPFVPTPESQTFRKCLKRMAGTTRLELATSAVTVHGNPLMRKGLLHNSFSHLARSGTARHTRAPRGNKN